MTSQETWNVGEPLVHKHQLGTSLLGFQFALQFLAWWRLWSCDNALTRWQALVMTELTDTVGSVAQSLQLEESLVVGKPPQKKCQLQVECLRSKLPPIHFVDAVCVKNMNLHAWRTHSKAYRNSACQTSLKHFVSCTLCLRWRVQVWPEPLCGHPGARSSWCS